MMSVLLLCVREKVNTLRKKYFRGSDVIPTRRHTAVSTYQAWLYVEAKGTIAPKPRLCPPNDMKHSLTNSKHQHIGAKGSVLWSAINLKMRFLLDPVGVAQDTPKTPIVGWGGDTPLGPSVLATGRLDLVEGDAHPKIFVGLPEPRLYVPFHTMPKCPQPMISSRMIVFASTSQSPKSVHTADFISAMLMY